MRRLCVECGRLRPILEFASENSSLCKNCDPGNVALVPTGPLPDQFVSSNGSINTKDAADLAGVSDQTIRNAAMTGEIVVLVKGDKRNPALYDRASVQAYVAARKSGNRKRGRKPKTTNAQRAPAEPAPQRSSNGGVVAMLQERLEHHAGLVEHYKQVIGDLGGSSTNGHGGEAGL